MTVELQLQDKILASLSTLVDADKLSAEQREALFHLAWTTGGMFYALTALTVCPTEEPPEPSQTPADFAQDRQKIRSLLDDLVDIADRLRDGPGLTEARLAEYGTRIITDVTGISDVLFYKPRNAGTTD